MQRKLFNDNWEFRKVLTDGTSTEWKHVDIPHDWHIYNTEELYQDGQGWYRKEYIYQAGITGERVFIRFDGVYMDSTVWVNDQLAGEWKYGYSTFEFEITGHIKQGSNEIKVRTVFQNPNSRWYSGAGIYRNVWLITKPQVCLVSDGTYVSTKRIGDSWDVYIDTEVDFGNLPDNGSYSISFTIAERITVDCTDSDMDVVCEAYADVFTDKMKTGTSVVVDNPHLWDITSPERYTLVVRLFRDGELIDSDELLFGFRSIDFRHESGFWLNGRHVKLHGVCMHHDLGCLGVAFNETALRRQLHILMDMGVNAIRTTHNMPAPELIEAADSLGILIVDEAFDIWEMSKTQYDYSRFFKEWARKDVRSWVRRDRNHPCVIMWSIGNEIYDTHADEHGQDITRMLTGYVYNDDYRHNAPVTIGSNYMPWENAQKCADIVKLAGYNYGEHCYRGHHEQHEDWIIYGSETASVVQSRGIYHFPENVSILDEDDLQCSSLGNSTTSWGAKSHEACIADDRDAEFSAGMFIWSGFDYIGEPTPYHTKNSYFGQIDTAGFPKDSYYLYQAEWTDYKTAPMVHLFPYWDFNPGQLIDIMVCSNAPEVELFFNGASLGRKSIDHMNGRRLYARWQKAYEPGELLAKAYDGNNNVIASDIQSSFGDAGNIVLRSDKQELKADGRDLAFVDISMSDVHGIPVRNASNRVWVSVTGAGRLMGLDNGDSTDGDSYKGCTKRLFSGKLLAVIASRTEPGNIYISVKSPGIHTAQLLLKSIQADVMEGISAIEENGSEVYETEIPIRKIEIAADVTRLDSTVSECDAEAVIYPADAIYRDISWRVTDDKGVTTNIAGITCEGSRVHVKALGDGDFRLRCISNNGTGHAGIISQLEFNAGGIGKAYIDPYELVAGSWYSDCKGDVTNGNERGIATSREKDTCLLYDNLDFGGYGSDEIHIPIFELDNKPLKFEIWSRMPDSPESIKLIDAIYDKPTKWNEYQEEIYKLPHRLKGVASIGFRFHRKAHVKGFYFTYINKAFEKLYAAECDSISGDDYTITNDAVEHIGNNVSLVYEDMDFGGGGISAVRICGRTPLGNNTIHIRFRTTDGNSSNQIIEFSGSVDYAEREFGLTGIKGKCQVDFVFMPGSCFDFKWFRFS